MISNSSLCSFARSRFIPFFCNLLTPSFSSLCLFLNVPNFSKINSSSLFSISPLKLPSVSNFFCLTPLFFLLTPFEPLLPSSQFQSYFLSFYLLSLFPPPYSHISCLCIYYYYLHRFFHRFSNNICQIFSTCHLKNFYYLIESTNSLAFHSKAPSLPIPPCFHHTQVVFRRQPSASFFHSPSYFLSAITLLVSNLHLIQSLIIFLA